MSTTSIPAKVKLALVGRAGGRCQYPGCNKRLDVDELTAKRMNRSVFAHIVADEPGGPRGDAVRSPLLKASIDNLMLLCLDHHKLVDVDELDEHPEELLQRFKREHEDRVINLLEIQPNLRTKLLLLKANIGARTVVVAPEDARRAVLPLYPVPSEFLIDLTQTAVRDDEPSFWSRNAEEIVRQVGDGLRPTTTNPTPTNLSVFALAPIPLLMVLGRALGDIAS